MKRSDILDVAADEGCTADERFESMKSIVDDLEDKFVEIRNLIDEFKFDDLDKITEARDLADQMADDLY